jgi:hypothetical protein
LPQYPHSQQSQPLPHPRPQPQFKTLTQCFFMWLFCYSSTFIQRVKGHSRFVISSTCELKNLNKSVKKFATWFCSMWYFLRFFSSTIYSCVEKCNQLSFFIRVKKQLLIMRCLYHNNHIYNS